MSCLKLEFLCIAMLGLSVLGAATANGETPPAQARPENNYLIGRGMADVTGPALGMQMWGFVRDGQLTQGVHIRLRARAFVIADPDSQDRVAFVSVDIGAIDHNITLEVVDRLKAQFGDAYSLRNVILSATHTHAGPGGYLHTRGEATLAGAFYPEHYERVVGGITEAIVKAHEDLQPGHILIDKAPVEGAGVNRSLVAYEQNPADERARYSDPIDKEMTQLKFVDDTGAIGVLNWFAVHPTSMTYDNRLISGDHKGYASLGFETAHGVAYDADDDFVAAFAQSTPGDVTPNLNLDNTGPGEDDIDSTAIIGQRQLDTAYQLFESAGEPLAGRIDARQIYIDLSNYKVRDEYTRAGARTTCPSAYGYSFAGGSTEDGGGHPLFREGMTERSMFRDFLIPLLTGAPEPTDAVRECQLPKAILFETGTSQPPLQSQIRSVSVARIGQLIILAMPAEVTTMSARRLRDTVMQQLGDWATHIVIAGYSNGYAGYVTTPEEYLIQQYEAGHTLHGRWTLPAYQQIAAQLAAALEQDEPIDGGLRYDDWRDRSVPSQIHDGAPDAIASDAAFGVGLALERSEFSVGDGVVARFYSGYPTERPGAARNFVRVDRQRGEDWIPVATDSNWATQIRWLEAPGRLFRPGRGLIAQIDWSIPEGTSLGSYRITHLGEYITESDDARNFEAHSPVFVIR